MLDEKTAAQRLLRGLENGGLSPAEAVVLAEDIDPVLFYVIVSFLREIHPASDPAATSVLERVVGLTSGSSVLVRRHKEGEQDPVSRWFEDEHEYRDFRGRGDDLVSVVVDKLES